MRTIFLTLLLVFAFWVSASANWFNQSEAYLATCQDEAVRRYHKGTSSEDVRRHIYLCMLAHGYVFKDFCDEKGWLRADCYRLRYKTEGR